MNKQTMPRDPVRHQRQVRAEPAWIVAEHTGGTLVVAVGNVCIVSSGRCLVAPDDLAVIRVDSVLIQPGFEPRDTPAPGDLLGAGHLAELRRNADRWRAEASWGFEQ
ncbi:hypothetical protein [Nocardia rhizosphaerihabitans]|uniref:Uncharacterized protein n=1 Tax=Nocardia rhizosphaerihabitans TaxID=1691570 RepID=A0ABQ2KW01_9NOCA|nr:hypothetical protein [Nocardia rhizosphaerihabitans]GGN94103.1 hypothetical protein GCM10011610_56710 [Nocardia rhizosphaerihabitans]